MWARIAERRVMELGTPGEMRERLNSLVRAGHKTATAGLLVQDYRDEDEAVEDVGEELALVDSAGDQVGLIAVDAVDVVRFDEVDWAFADAEGEGFTSIEHWRTGHRAYWQAEGVSVSDSTMIVCLRFHVVP